MGPAYSVIPCYRDAALLTYIGMPRIPVYLEKLSRPA